MRTLILLRIFALASCRRWRILWKSYVESEQAGKNGVLGTFRGRRRVFIPRFRQVCLIFGQPSIKRCLHLAEAVFTGWDLRDAVVVWLAGVFGVLVLAGAAAAGIGRGKVGGRVCRCVCSLPRVLQRRIVVRCLRAV